MKQRFDNYIRDTQNKMQEDRDTVRKETKHTVDELNKKVRTKWRMRMIRKFYMSLL